jgi:hypothetical protein
MGGLLVASCSGSPTAARATTTTSSATYIGTALSWLTTKGRPFNKKLNDDQALVDTASVTSPEIGAATYFARLAEACSRLNADARLAQRVQAAPSGSLEGAWLSMTAHTETYALDCLTLTHTRSSASLTRWNQSLTAMNAANGALNAAVAAVRSQAGETTPAG